MRGTKVRRWSLLAALGVVLTSSVGGFTPANAAVPVTQTGWWTRSPAPPTVPDGGLAVGVAPDGNVSVGAIKLDTAGGATSAKVTLKESDGQGQQAASLQVCTTNDEWNGAKGDDLATAPRATCPEKPVLLTRNDDGTWTADVASLIASQSGEVSIMIVPAPSAAPVPGVQTGAFQVSFDKPVVDGAVLPATDTSSSSSGSDIFGADTAPSSSGSFDAPAYSVETSPAFAPVGNTPSAVQPAAQADSTLSSPNAGGGSVTFPVRSVGAPGKKTSKATVVGIILLSMLIGAAAAALRSAQEKGVFERLIPSGGGSSLKLPD